MSTLIALYFSIWIIASILFLLYSLDVFGERHSMFDDRTTYIIHFVTITLTLLTIYAGLKLFRFKKVIDSIKQDPRNSLQKYINWNTFRYIWFIIILWLNLFTFYATESGYMYLALAGTLLISTCFCFPAERECEDLITKQ